MVSPITVDGSLERRNIFVGEAFGPPNVRVVFAGAAEDTQEREDRVFLLIGPSCVMEEKATCIDAFCNFFYGVQKDDGYRLHIANEKFDKTTPNKAIVTYVFNDSKMPFRPIVVDVKDDDASLLHKWLTENSRLRIDVVCIVFNLLGRIETKHETAIKEMLSILPKRIRSSASVLLTNSDGHPPPMATLRRFDLQEAPVYKLNWTTLFTGKQDDSLKELLRSNYWNMSEKSLKDMIARIQTLHPQTFNGLPHEPPMFVIHLKPDNASSSSSSSTSTSTFVERRTEHHTTTTHHHYDLPPAMEPVQGRPEPSPPLVKTTIFQTTSKHVEDKTVEGPPAGIPKELLKQIEQRSSDEHSGEKKVVVEKTITVKMVKKDDENDDVIDRARAKSLERQALEQKRREEEEKEMRKIKDQLEKERREREAIERRIREQEQAEIAKRAKQEEERLLLIRVEEERREKHRLEQLAIEERTRREVDERARRLSAEKREMEEERRRLDEERRRLEGRRLEELKKIEEEKLRLDEQRRLLSHEKSQTEAEKRRIEAEMREGERRRKEEEEARRRREEEEERRKREEEDARRKREEEELKIKREVERKAREAEEKLRQETESRREREEEERKRREREEEQRKRREEEDRKRKSMEEKNITITYERTIERTRTEEVDERVLGHRDLSPSAYMTRTYLNGDGPRQTTVIEQGGYRHDGESSIGDAPMVRFVFDESTRSYIHHLVDPNRGIHRDPSPNRNEQPGSVRILSRTETLIDDPYDDGGFQRTSPERVGHHRLSSPTRDERYQHVRGPSDLRSPGVAATPASPEMLRRGETLRRTNQDVQRDSYPSGRESRKRERTQYENLPMDEAGNAYIIPDRMRYSKSPVIMRVKMSPKEKSEKERKQW